MKKERQRQINIDAVIKVQNFLKAAKNKIDMGYRFSLNDLCSYYSICRTLATVSIKNNYFKRSVVKGEYEIGENYGHDETSAKKLIELVRLYKISKNTPKISNETKDNTLDEQTDVPRIKSNTEAKLGQILEKAILGKQDNLFTAQEKEFDDKLKIACAIASGMHSPANNWMAINNAIISATNDLYKKLKQNG